PLEAVPRVYCWLLSDYLLTPGGAKSAEGNVMPSPEKFPYLTSTLAPASSSFFFAVSASAFGAPSSTGLGAPSTSALASARPRPALTSRTALITAIFLSAGTDARITSKAVLASAAGAAAPPPPGA